VNFIVFWPYAVLMDLLYGLRPSAVNRDEKPTPVCSTHTFEMQSAKVDNCEPTKL
jgi:hypothetical protein